MTSDRLASPEESRRDADADTVRLRAIFESVVDFAIVATDRDGRVTDWNSGAERVLGWRAEEMLGETAERFFTPEDRAAGRIEAEMRRALEAGRASDERWHLRADGSRFWASGELMPLRDRDGAHLGFVKILRDRTAEHRAGEVLRETEAALLRAQEAGGVGVFWIGIEDNLLHGSPQLYRLYGLAPGETYPAETVERLVVPEDAHLVSSTVARRGGEPRRDVEYRIRRADTGELRWIARRGEIERDAAGRPQRFVGVARDVTEQRAAMTALEAGEARLRESEDHYRHTVELNPQVPWTADPQGGITSYSTRWLDLTGQAPGEPDGAGWIKALHPDDVAGTLEVFGASLASGEPVDVDYRIRVAATGAHRWMRARALPRRDESGAVVRWYGVVEDVHDRRLAEERLRASEELYRGLFNVLDAGFCVIEMAFDPATGGAVDYRFLEVNRAFEAQTGLADPVGRWMRDLAPGHEQAWFDRYGEVARTGRPLRAEGEAVALGRYYDVSAFRVGPPEAGQVAALFRDITARRRTELALRESEARFRTFAQAVPNHIWSATPDGRLDWANEPTYAYSGGAADGTIGDTWTELVHPDDLPRVAARWAASLAGGEVYETEFRVRRADGVYRWFLVRALPIRGPDGAIVRWIGANTDVEDQRAATEALARLNASLEGEVAARTRDLMSAEAALRQAHKMEAVGQLTGGIAHDFNNLLAGITGSLELMQVRMRQGRTESLERYAATAMSSANRAAALTHRLLAFARRQPLDPKPVSANTLVAGMEDLLRRTLGERVGLEILTASGLWPTLCDPHQLENAVLNLAINARDAMPEGGRLTIETANAELDAAAARAHPEVEPGPYVTIGVTDTGMAPDVIAKAFDPFFTTKPPGQGTGLGLSMIYGFARQSEGFAQIESALGRGTTVRLYLPRHRGEAAAEAGAPGGGEAPRAGRGETVLVVEDEASVRDLVVEVLQDLGYEALVAQDGPGGLALLCSDRRIDLVVSDVGLPGLDGRRMIEQARERRPGLKVLFITGYAENALFGGGHLEPGTQMMTKPFAIEALAGRIREMIEPGPAPC